MAIANPPLQVDLWWCRWHVCSASKSPTFLWPECISRWGLWILSVFFLDMAFILSLLRRRFFYLRGNGGENPREISIRSADQNHAAASCFHYPTGRSMLHDRKCLKHGIPSCARGQCSERIPARVRPQRHESFGDRGAILVAHPKWPGRCPEHHCHLFPMAQTLLSYS